MITIYGKDLCPWCDRAREICEQYGLQYEYKSLDDRFDGESNKTSLREMAVKDNIQVKTVPQIWWNNNYVGGFQQLANEIENTRNFGQEKI